MGDVQIRELDRGESGLAHAAMLELRPGIGDAAQFAIRVDQVQRDEGYRLVAAFQAAGEPAVAVAGSASSTTSHGATSSMSTTSRRPREPAAAGTPAC